MEIESLKALYAIGGTYTYINSSLHSFDLPVIIREMKHSPDWIKGELNSMILLNSPEKRIVLITLHEGTAIDSYQSNDSITFRIIAGKLRFHTRAESVILNKGQVLTLHENIKYSLISMEESVFLLTITGNTLKQ